MKNLIGVSGQASHGKDTAADYIAYKYSFVKIAFADKIKRILMHLYDINYNSLWGSSEERGKIDPRYGKSVREFIQGFGDTGRELDINTWVNYTQTIVNKINGSFGYFYVNYHGLTYDATSIPKSVIVPDCRYLNELESIRQNGGLLIRVVRPNSKIQGKVAEHSSETDQLNIPDSFFDELVINEGSLLDLHSKIDQILLKYK